MSSTVYIIYNKIKSDFITDMNDEFVFFYSESEAEQYVLDETDLMEDEYRIDKYDRKTPKWELEEERGEQMWERLHDSEDFHYPDRD